MTVYVLYRTWMLYHIKIHSLVSNVDLMTGCNTGDRSTDFDAWHGRPAFHHLQSSQRAHSAHVCRLARASSPKSMADRLLGRSEAAVPSKPMGSDVGGQSDKRDPQLSFDPKCQHYHHNRVRCCPQSHAAQSLLAAHCQTPSEHEKRTLQHVAGRVLRGQSD